VRRHAYACTCYDSGPRRTIALHVKSDRKRPSKEHLKQLSLEIKEGLDELSEKVETQHDKVTELIARANKALKRSREIVERAKRRKKVMG